MKKKLDTRFPAARIKKIMQADEDVGKIAAATPVLMSKALEMFLQDLLDKTYVVTAARGVKTVSTNHLRTCIQSNTVFDFLKEVATRVPDLGGESECNDEKPPGHGHRRKVKDEEQESSGEDAKRIRIESLSTASTSGQRHAPCDRSTGKNGADSKSEHRAHSRNGSRTPKLESEERSSVSDPKLEEASCVVKMEVCNVPKGSKAPLAAKVECTDEKVLARDDDSAGLVEVLFVDNSATKRTPRDFDLNVGLDAEAFDDALEAKSAVEVLKEKGNLVPNEKSSVAVVKEKGENGGNGRLLDLLITPQAAHYDEDDYDCEDDEGG